MSDWPYDDNVTEAPAEQPSWGCPEGLCDCHPLTDPPELEFAVLLCDENGARMPGARCRVLVGSRVLNSLRPNADGSGWLHVIVHHELANVVLEWAPASTPIEERYPYRLRYQLILGKDQNRALEHRLANLGFLGGATLRDNVEAFQRQYGIRPVTGVLRDIEAQLLTFHDQGTLPEVPAGDAPSAPVAPAPPPQPPSMEGHDKVGDGQVPGQGTARSDMVSRELRLLDFEQKPAPAATCQIEVTGWRFDTAADNNGVARFRAPRGAALCAANWQFEEAMYARRAIELMAHHLPDTFERLGNLGYAQPTSEQRVRAYQREMGHVITGKEEDIAEEVKRWHDGGQKPGATEPRQSAFAGSNVQLASFIPPIHLPPPPGVLKILSTVGPVVIGPLGPFLVVKPPFYSTDATLAAQFTTFATTLPDVALSITEITNPKRPYFGVRDDEVHFSASTCKAIALFSVSLLLMALRRHAVSAGLAVPANKLLGKASKDFKADILSVARAHKSLAPAIDFDLLPQYTIGFKVTAATGTQTSHTVDFSASLSNAIDEMMGVSSNNDSKTVIHNTGFGYIHGAVVNAGLFAAGSDTGLWLAGDYTGTRTARRIPAVNDGDTAQGATTRTFVAMMDMSLDSTFPNTTFLADKLALTRVKHPSWLTDPNRSSRQKKGFSDERGKIGDERLKVKFGGHFVHSEIIELKHIATDRRFLVSYQNAKAADLPTISDLVFDGLDAYVTATTPKPQPKPPPPTP